MRILLMLGAVSVIGLTAGCQEGGQTAQKAAPPAQTQMQPAPAPTADTGMKADTAAKDTSMMKRDSMKKDTSGM